MKKTKLGLLKITPVVIIIALLGWGISSRATDDIKSATANFSALGTVSEISDDGITITDAKGSDSSGKTTYELNIKYLEEMEMNTYVPLNFTDIKVGDKIIAQGLTNGDTYFIKRIISFTSTPTPVEAKVPKEIATSTATSTDEIVATSTATTTETVATSTPGPDVSTGTTTTEIESSATTTEISTSTDNSTSTSIIEAVTNVVEDIIDTVTETVQTVVEAVTGSDSSPAPVSTTEQ